MLMMSPSIRRRIVRTFLLYPISRMGALGAWSFLATIGLKRHGATLAPERLRTFLRKAAYKNGFSILRDTS